MKNTQKTNLQSTHKTANEQAVEQTPATAMPVQGARLDGVEDLTQLQRRRLDAAVMLLVNYLVSASSGG